MRRAVLFVVALAAHEAIICTLPAQVVYDPLKQGPKWQPPSQEELYRQVIAWAVERELPPETDAKIAKIWEAEDEQGTRPTERLGRLVETFALVDDRAGELVELCSGPRNVVTVDPADWLEAGEISDLMRNNLRLWYGRWLVHENLYDEALAQLSALEPDSVVDPASLLFYQGVVYHRLLNQEAGIQSIVGLLEEVADPPARYVAVAELMHDDLAMLEEESLDHVSRRMDDIRRRLALGRAGERVRDIENGVIDSLDKLIEEIENQQQQQQQQQQQSGRGSNRSSRPADDSRILAGRGPGNVGRRELEGRGGWGALPPKQREAALQQIGSEFPAHYREAIEQYFRRLASEDGARANDRNR